MPIHGYPGNVITANPVAPTSTVATGVWTTEQQLKAVAAGNWPFTIPTQQISRSLRFNRPDSAYLNRTFSTGNRKTWTWSCWIKRSTLDVGGGDVPLFSSAGASSTYDSIRFNSDSTFRIYYSGGAAYGVAISGSPVFRDVSAWYHIVVAQDTAQATESLRLRVWINGVQQTLTGIPAQNYESGFNSAVQHEIGKQYIQSEYFPGYMAEVYFIGGSSLAASSFGQTNASTGVWEPINYTGTYGTNGFYVNFSDNSNTTAATLGKDYSGNGNNWTPNNFSVTAGSGNDSLVDTPTSYGSDTGVGGEVRGNYATLNPLKIYGANFTYSNGNLQITDSSSSYVASIPTLTPPNSGKWYWEVTVLAQTTSSTIILGLATEANAYSTSAGTMASYGRYRSDGDISNLAGTTQTAGSSYTTSDVIGVALDVDSGTVRFYKNGVAQGATPSFSFTAGTVLVPYIVGDNTAGTKTLAVNFGQRAFAYTAPSGFKALCTQNLPTPTIGATSMTQANDYFDVTTYSGSASSQSIINSGSMQPDFVWIKCRNTTDSHNLTDAVRGTNKNLFSNSTAAEDTVARLTSFNSNGVTLAGGYGNTNNAGQTYVAWQWNAGGSTVTNTSGTISAQVRASTTSGFSIVTYTGTGSNATVGHGLGVAPDMIIVKSRSVGTGDWVVWHSSLTSSNNNYLILNSTAAVNTANQPWNNTLPTSSVFSLRTWDSVNGSGSTYVAYCFDTVPGYSAFGSYTGNGSADGPFVYTGFRPEFIMTKSTSGSREWYMYDAARDTYNVATNYLRANTSAAEGSFTSYDMVSNGFKLRSSDTAFNGSGETYIYMAFAEFPFKFSLAR